MKKKIDLTGNEKIPGLKKILRLMKLTVFMILISVASVLAGKTYSQTKTLTFHMENATVKEVLSRIEDQSEFRIMYSGKFVDVDREVSVNVEKKKIETVLDLLFAGTDVGYTVKDRFIILITPELMNEGTLAVLQQRTVSGKVTDSSGQPLPGVTVVLKGTTQGTVTNADGNYSLTNIPDDAILVFSFVGMLTQEVEVGNKISIDVTMTVDAIGIEEVVAIGYGTMKKSDLTGSVSSVKSADLERVPVLSLDQAIQGRASGVYVSNNNANPGGEVNIRIRGTNSIQGDNEPLYVIDGYVGGNINTVNPSDIESIEILKDASSTAIYGARGANGVVIVTTKSGKQGKNLLNFDMFYGWQSVTKKLDLMGATDYANFINAIDVDRGNDLTYPNLSALEYDTDWQDVILRTAPWQQYTISGSGGTNKLNYYVSGSYVNQQGIVKETGYERYNIRANIDSEISERINFGARLGFSRIDRTRQSGEEVGRQDDTGHPVGRVLSLQPTISAFDENGEMLPTIVNADDILSGNPLFDLENIEQKQFSTNFTGNLFAEIELLKALRFRTSFGFNITDRKQNRYKPSTSYSTTGGYRNSASVASNFSTGWLNENFFSYNTEFGIHTLQLTGGATFQGLDSENSSMAVSDFAIDDFLYHNMAAGSTVSSYDTGMSEWRQVSFFGRVHYTIKNKYLFTVNSRYDGSSKFGKDNKWGYFPSGAIAWRIIEEDFIKELGIFSNLKLRVSYGISGSEALGPYNSLAVMDALSAAYIINDVPVVGYYSSRLPNPDLRWEETSQLDIGLDFGILSGRLNFVADYYNKVTDNLFLNRPLPQTSGVNYIRYNIGSLKNSGFELGMNAVPVSKGGFRWLIDVNVNIQQSEILDLGDVDELITGELGGGYRNVGSIQIMREGEPLGAFYGYKTDGVWGTDDDITQYTQFGTAVEPGDIKLVNVTDEEGNDPNVNADDRQILGYSQPKFFGGINNTFKYKDFDLSAFFQFVTGTKVLNGLSMHYRNPGSYHNKHVDLNNYWTPDNQNTDIPRAGSIIPELVLDRYLEDGDFLRMREITVGYSIPAKVLNRLNISRLRLYITGTNLFTLTKYTGYDPEVNIAGGDINIINFDNGSYPRSKSVILGLNLSF
jgi:TonB-dependent starch-binding outer membrane protein SusC